MSPDEVLATLRQANPNKSDEELLRFAEQRGYIQPQSEGYNALMDGTSAVDRFRIGLGRGFVDVGQGIKQLALHGAELIPGVDVGAAEYDRRIAEEAAMFNRDAEGSLAAQVGRIGSNIAGTAVPGGAVGRAAAMGGKGLGAALRAGGAAGAVEAGLIADTDGESDIVDRLVQSAVGAALGAGGGAAVEGGRRLVQGAANLPRNLYEGATSGAGTERGLIGRLGSAIRGNSRVRTRGEEAQRMLGIDVLSPAELSGSPAAKMAENLAGQSYFTMDRVNLANARRFRAFGNRISQMARSMGAEGDNVTVAKQIQGATRNMVRTMAKERSDFGRQAYGAVDRAAGGAPVVRMDNTRRALAEIIEEYKGVQTGDAAKIVSQATSALKKIGEDPLTAQQALRNMQAWSQAARGTGNLFDDVDRGINRTLAGRLADSVMSDLDNVASQGGRVGDLARRANDGWRAHSSRIDTLKNSVLGDVLGEDFADELTGVAFNRIAPEDVFSRLQRANPSELKIALGYLDESAPEVAGNFRRSLIESAVLAARESAPSAGPNALPINPATFIRELQQGASGSRAVKGMKRLEAIYGDTEHWPQIQALFDIGERLADATGRNFSGTAAANQFYQLLGSVYGNLAQVTQKLAGNTASLIGLNQVARGMMPGAANAPRFQIGQNLVTGDPLASLLNLNPARFGAAPALGLLAAQQAPELTERNTQNNR